MYETGPGRCFAKFTEIPTVDGMKREQTRVEEKYMKQISKGKCLMMIIIIIMGTAVAAAICITTKNTSIFIS